MAINEVILLVVLVIAVTFDLKWSKIPNWITFSAFVAGICFQLLELDSTLNIATLIGSIALPFMILIPFYIMGGMAAGDVKLMTACGALLGWPVALLATGLTLMTGTVLGFTYLVLRGGADGLILKFPAVTKTLIFLSKRTEGEIYVNGVAKSRFPYALAIAIGSTSAVVLSGLQ